MLRINLQLFGGEKTEPATPRKREEARKKGQTVKSGEIGTAALVIFGFLVIRFSGPYMATRLKAFLAHMLETSSEWDGGVTGAQNLFLEAILEGALVLLPIFGLLFLISFLSQAVQVGFMLTLEAIAPKFSRINPLEGLKRIFSKRALVEFMKSMFKISVISFLAYRQVRAAIQWLPGLGQMDLGNSVLLIEQTVFSLALWIGVFLLILAITDYLYQRWEFEQSIKMSKQEIKDEYKQSEGDPQIRAKIRQKQRQIASQRMMQDVPSADVVITNPTHFAIAIKYTLGEMNAPRVVAKGVGAVALKIKEIALENQVVTVENPTLARALYKTTEVGQEIPSDLYPAVAEVLAFVFRLKNRKIKN